MDKKVFNAALKASLPVLMGYLAMGMAAGILLAGTIRMKFLPFWAFLSSAVNISGALQFIMVDWTSKLLPLTQVALLTFCLNVRYAMYGFSLIEKFRPLPVLTRWYLIWSLTDETYALEVDSGDRPIAYCIWVAFLDHMYWIAGVVAGALIGAKLPFSTEGIDFAMTALFLVVLTDQCRDRSNRIFAAVGLFSATVGRTFFPVENMLIPAMTLMAAIFILCRKYFEKHLEHQREEKV